MCKINLCYTEQNNEKTIQRNFFETFTEVCADMFHRQREIGIVSFDGACVIFSYPHTIWGSFSLLSRILCL